MKRHETLKPLSRDHHHGLLLCWKIREDLKKQISEDRIKSYTDFFFTSQLRPHFEEKQIFPLLGENHPLIVRALNEHRRLEQLFKGEGEKDTFVAIEHELNRHIRFEKRQLFMELQNSVSADRLQQIENEEENVITPDPDDWEDKFWMN